MLDDATRNAILKLHAQGHGNRTIAKALGIARVSVRAVIASGVIQAPALERVERAKPWREQILELHARFGGHLGRVHETLTAQGASLSYSALTAFCRRHRIGHTPKPPAGRYHFAPGQEMQHDTSPHRAQIGGVLTRVQTASLVLCCSRMIFFQCYPRFTRFECKVFLTEALVYFGGAAGECMVDNSNVIVASGSGASMIPAPEMAAFAERFGFRFIAHAIGDANRSARVEAPFHRIERGFLLGQEFADWAALNAAARTTCEVWNSKHSNKLHGSRRELFAVERPQLKPLPLHVPEVYQLHGRIVDPEGFVHVNRVRYSVPYTLIGRQLEVRETLDRIDVYQGPRRVASHARVHGPLDTRISDPAHRPPRGQGLRHSPGPPPEETELLVMEPRLASYLAKFKAHTGTRRLPLRHLLSMLRDYPRAAFLAAVQTAEQYGLFDLQRLEKLVLKQIAQDFFVLPEFPEDADE
jgi:hypothetical protein